MLEMRDITVDFVGLRAVDHASFRVEQGQITGLIGPNGAGKTTLFNVVSGMIRPSSGRVTFAGQDISSLGPEARSHLGIARTFQVVKPFGDLSAHDNVLIGALTRGLSVANARSAATRILAQLELTRFANTPARALPLALRKRLELARALATEPKLLLLDELMGGLNPTEVNEMLALIDQLHASGITFLVIEHNMKAIMRVAERVVVLNQGALLCEGTPREVTQDPRVIATYLGEVVESS